MLTPLSTAQESQSPTQKLPIAKEFALTCSGDLPPKDCVPACDETTHSYMLLATIDGDDSSFTCEIHHGLYSWVGKSAAGGFLGADIRAFISAIIAGAAGFYSVTVAENDAKVSLDLTIQPGQSVSILGDPAVADDGGAPTPIWGGGGFHVVQGGTLTLRNIQLALYSTVIACVT